MEYAPIAIFAFNRPDTLKNTIESLLCNEESHESDLFVFVDGPRIDKEGECEKVLAVHEYVKSVSGFKSLSYRFSKVNKGLGPTIIAGVTEIVNKYGCVIVFEDDLVLAKNALSFLNQGLQKYQVRKEIFSVCAYTSKVKIPKDYKEDAYFCVRSSSWGWATWADRWNSVDWELKDWQKVEPMAKAFNKWGGSDCYSMLKGWHDGLNKSWAIRFCFSQFIQNKLSVFPIISKIDNEGFTGEGTNCRKYNRFKFEFDNSDNKTFNFPEKIVINNQLYKSAMSYHTITKRIWSKIMYIIER